MYSIMYMAQGLPELLNCPVVFCDKLTCSCRHHSASACALHTMKTVGQTMICEAMGSAQVTLKGSAETSERGHCGDMRMSVKNLYRQDHHARCRDLGA